MDRFTVKPITESIVHTMHKRLHGLDAFRAR